MHDTSAVRTTLAHDFPELSVESISFMAEDWNNVAYLVNNQLVFRLPTPRVGRQASRRQSVRREVALLKAIHGQLGRIATPMPKYVAADETYFGYPALPGQPLEDHPKAYESYVQQNFITYCVAVAVRLPQLISLGDATGLGLVAYQQTNSPLSGVQYALKHKLIPQSAAYLAIAVLNEYPHRYSRAQHYSVAMHGNLRPHNWLADENGLITGLVDWTDACIAPPEHQLGIWGWEKNPKAISQAAKQYDEATDYTSDIKLIYLGFLNDLIGGIGHMVMEGRSPNDAAIATSLNVLDFWAEYLQNRFGED